MKIFPFQAIYPEFKLVASTDSFIKSVKNQFEKYRTNGFFKRSSQEAFYIHEIEKEGKIYRGLIAAVDIEEYISEKILIHEKTIASKEQITMELILDRNAMIKPILVAFDNVKSITNDLANYKDLTHFSTKVNEEILKMISMKKNKLTVDSISDYEKAFIENVTEYKPYSSLISQ